MHLKWAVSQCETGLLSWRGVCGPQQAPNCGSFVHHICRMLDSWVRCSCVAGRKNWNVLMHGYIVARLACWVTTTFSQPTVLFKVHWTEWNWHWKGKIVSGKAAPSTFDKQVSEGLFVLHLLRRVPDECNDFGCLGVTGKAVLCWQWIGSLGRVDSVKLPCVSPYLEGLPFPLETKCVVCVWRDAAGGGLIRAITTQMIMRSLLCSLKTKGSSATCSLKFSSPKGKREYT